MVFHAILRQISIFCYCAISARELSVCAIFYTFSNYVLMMVMVADVVMILLTSVRDKYVDELSTYYAIGVGKLESFEVNIFVLSRFF